MDTMDFLRLKPGLFTEEKHPLIGVPDVKQF